MPYRGAGGSIQGMQHAVDAAYIDNSPCKGGACLNRAAVEVPNFFAGVSIKCINAILGRDVNCAVAKNGRGFRGIQSCSIVVPNFVAVLSIESKYVTIVRGYVNYSVDNGRGSRNAVVGIGCIAVKLPN